MDTTSCLWHGAWSKQNNVETPFWLSQKLFKNTDITESKQYQDCYNYSELYCNISEKYPLLEKPKAVNKMPISTVKNIDSPFSAFAFLSLQKFKKLKLNKGKEKKTERSQNTLQRKKR